MMLAFTAYTWWKFLHVAGVIAFVMFHGVSMTVALQLRRERDRGRIATMTQLSGSSLRGMYVALLWLIVFGVIAGIQGEWWNDGWFWISVGLLVVAIAEMSAVARPYYERVKEAIEVRPSGVPRRSDEELDEILRSPIGLWNTVFGIAVLAVIAWLMIFKPFVVL
ncbi:MAG TPA: hypothetical protein VGQ02_06530 [Candidatus Limnocylindrales bacterium]|nr:hypothetical protein [Candidatus Limnocylindrales bacterium]